MILPTENKNPHQETVGGRIKVQVRRANAPRVTVQKTGVEVQKADVEEAKAKTKGEIEVQATVVGTEKNGSINPPSAVIVQEVLERNAADQGKTANGGMNAPKVPNKAEIQARQTEKIKETVTKIKRIKIKAVKMEMRK